MMHKTYEFLCQLPAQAASEQVAGLLAKEGVEYKSANLSVVSVRTPIAVLGIQPKLYSHGNWVGLNPFTFVSGVDVQCEQVADGSARVTVRVNRLRAFLFAALSIAASFPAVSAMPKPAGALVFFGFACAAGFGIVSFLGGYLIRKEFSDLVKNQSGSAAQ